jgi:hypothetical protein
MPPDSSTLIPLALRVGITGHRWRDAADPSGRGLDPAHADALRATVGHVLREIAATVNTVRALPDARWTTEVPRLSLVTALADGADTLAAEAAVAVEVGYQIELVVPYDLATYAPRCAPGTVARSIWDRASSRLILDGLARADEPVGDGTTVRSESALVETNRRLVWNCDLLIAVWDGRPARGEAGTARVIARARDEGVPIVHVAPDDSNAWTILDAAGGIADGASPKEALAAVVRRLLTPPATATQGGHAVLEGALDDYRRETPPSWVVRNITARIYKVITWLLSGLDRDVGLGALPPSPQALGVPWQPTPSSTEASTRRTRLLDHAFQRADYFATAYAARHRSTFTTILTLAPIAVVCAWCGSVAPESKKGAWAVAEVVLLLVLIGFFFRSRRRRFHERWLDYRLLAERLRHHGFLWMLGRTSPVVRVPTHAIFTDPRPAWVNWQYRAITRPLGVAPIALTPATLRELAADVRRGLVEAQAQYCRTTHRIAHRAEHWLHGLPWVPLLAAVGAAATHVITHALHVTLSKRSTDLLTMAGVIGPAFGAALHGFASQSGFQEQGIRTDASAQQLDRFLARLDALDLDQPLASQSLGDLVLEIADVLGEDLAGWRVDYLARPLTPPG